MTRGDIKDLIGRKTNIMNSSGTIVDGLVTDDDLDVFIQMRYREMFNVMAEKYPENFEVTTTWDTVISRTDYAFSGGSADLFEVRYVGIKYASTDTYFTRAMPKPYSDLFKYSTDTSWFNTSSPKYALTTLKQTTTEILYPAIMVLPAPTAVVTDGLMVRYVEMPPDFSDDADVLTILPDTAQHIVGYAVIADVWEKKGDWAKAERAFNRFLLARKEFMEGYTPRASDTPVRMIPSMEFNPLRRDR